MARIWLENEGLLIPNPQQGGNRNLVAISRRGAQFLEQNSPKLYKATSLLPKKVLDPTLAARVRPTFLAGEYDTAVFAAFKEVEVRVRTYARLPAESIGTRLMRAAFHPDTDPLRDQTATQPEQQATAHLFAGAIGLFKNPGSHRPVDYAEPDEPAELILFANTLLRILERQRPSSS